jgi:hypothetical protein
VDKGRGGSGVVNWPKTSCLVRFRERQKHAWRKVLLVIYGPFKPAPNFFRKLAVLVILELRIPPQKLS